MKTAAIILSGLSPFLAFGAEETYSLDNLIGRPPFGVAPVSGAEKTKAEKARYELRGFFGRGPDMMASVRDNAGGEAHWLRFGDNSGKWRLVNADRAAGVVVVEIDGQTVELKLSKTDGLPLPVQGATAPAAPALPTPLVRGEAKPRETALAPAAPVPVAPASSGPAPTQAQAAPSKP